MKKILFSLFAIFQLSATPTNTYIGELQEKWTFPSDHLPVGATINNLHIATWNVLNTAHIEWIERNTQGLKRSSILTLHNQLLPSGITLREEHVLQNLISMLDHPTHPRSLIALQECGENFLAQLEKRLPPHIEIIYSSNTPTIDQNILLYDKRHFTPIKTQIITDAFPCNPGRPLMDILLEHNNTLYQIINTHTSGDPNLPGRFELARYIAKSNNPNAITIALGDMNFDPVEMEDAFAKANLTTFQNLICYRTIVGIDKVGKAIDHIFIDFGPHQGKATPNQPSEVLPGLQDTVELLEEPDSEIAS